MLGTAPVPFLCSRWDIVDGRILRFVHPTFVNAIKRMSRDSMHIEAAGGRSGGTCKDQLNYILLRYLVPCRLPLHVVWIVNPNTVNNVTHPTPPLRDFRWQQHNEGAPPPRYRAGVDSFAAGCASCTPWAPAGMRSFSFLGGSSLYSAFYARPALSWAFSVRSSALASSTCLIFSQSSSSCCRLRALKAC